MVAQLLVGDTAIFGTEGRTLEANVLLNSFRHVSVVLMSILQNKNRWITFVPVSAIISHYSSFLYPMSMSDIYEEHHIDFN